MENLRGSARHRTSGSSCFRQDLVPASCCFEVGFSSYSVRHARAEPELVCLNEKHRGTRHDTTDARPTGRPGWRWIKAALLVFLAFALVALVFMIYHAEPILQARIHRDTFRSLSEPSTTGRISCLPSPRLSSLRPGLKVFGKGDLNVHRLG